MQQAKRIEELLGGPEVLGAKITSAKALDLAVRQGFPYKSFEAVSEFMEIDPKDMAAMLSSSVRTMQRRKTEKRLSQAESDKLARLVRVTARAEEVLENRESAMRWLRKPNRSLGGQVPLKMLETDIGANEVLQALGRIDMGVYG